MTLHQVLSSPLAMLAAAIVLACIVAAAREVLR